VRSFKTALSEPNLIGRILHRLTALLFPKALKQRTNDVLNFRHNRIHAFVDEALALIQNRTQIFDDLSEPEMHVMSGKFRKYGSDKEDRHSYSWVYSTILHGIESPKILEIGLGSLNGYPYGGLAPGGSIKAWRDAFPTATIVGADIDSESVAAIDEIGFVVDQTSDESLQSLSRSLSDIGKFNLIVDDGFHDPHANMRTLLRLHGNLQSGGYFVIEDVHHTLINFWKGVSESLPGDLSIYDLRNQRKNCEDNILLVFKI
jgi:hypothetical protein